MRAEQIAWEKIKFRPFETPRAMMHKSQEYIRGAAKKQKQKQARPARHETKDAETRNRAGDLQICSLTLSQLSYRGLIKLWQMPFPRNNVS